MAEIIRVLHVVGSLGIGGIQSYLMELYRHIDRQKIQFDFIVHIKAEHNYEEEIIKLGGRIFYIDEDAFENKKWVKYLKYWKKFFLEHPEYKIVHGHLRSTSSIYLLEAKKNKCYTIAHSHATSNGYGVVAKVKDLFQFPTRYIADYCIGCSQQANVWMFGKKRSCSKRCIVLRNGIDLKKYYYDVKVRNKKRKELNIKEDAIVVGCVGRFVAQKNQAIIVEAIPSIVTVRPEILFIFVGDGPLFENNKKRLKELHVKDENVKMLGSRSDVSELLNAFDLFVLPSQNEGLGIAAIEAQTNGMLVLVSEAIPQEAYLSSNIRKVDNTSQAWADAILQGITTERIDTKNIPSFIDYNINVVAQKLEKIYLKAEKK